MVRAGPRPFEAKPVATPLTGVERQSAMYATGLPKEVHLAARTVDGRLPFVIEANGVETHLTDGYDPLPRVRTAMAHLNLVMIHPFRDGDGRTARVLQT